MMCVSLHAHFPGLNINKDCQSKIEQASNFLHKYVMCLPGLYAQIYHDVVSDSFMHRGLVHKSIITNGLEAKSRYVVAPRFGA